MRTLRLRFWLFACDVLDRLGMFPSRAWDYCIERASDCTDWGDPIPPDVEDPPW